MKLIMRADDLGFSEAVNYGIEKTIREGVITSVGIMPNMDYAKHGYELIKDYDIALGQHTNICVGKPLTNPKLIPSLVQENGEFCSRVEEAEIEIEAQLQRFIEITGKTPDYFEGHAVFSENFFIALKNVAKKYGLFFENPGFDKNWEQENGIVGLHFIELDENGLYDPSQYLESCLKIIKEAPCSVAIFHPGFLDQYILSHSSFTLIRPMECEFLCGEWVKNWIVENEIKLVDFRNYK